MYSLFKLVLMAIYLSILIIVNLFLPFSMFYSKIYSYESLFSFVDRSNVRRTKAGRTYFSRLDSSASLKFYDEQKSLSGLRLAIGIITIKRSADINKKESVGYLFQSASAVDKMLKNDPLMKNSFAFVCNVDLYPRRHVDAIGISKFMPFVERYGDNSIGLKDLTIPNSNVSFKQYDKHRDVYEKETYDYVFCLQAAASLNPNHILLIEEDAVPHRDFPQVLNYLLSFNTWSNLDHPLPLFWKFYYPAKWQGFSFRFTEIADLLSFSCVGAFVFCLIVYLSQLKLNQRSFNSMFVIAFVVSLISCYIIGRQNLNEFRRLSPQFYRLQSSEGCCTQAMMYPIEYVQRLSQYMITESFIQHTDILISEFSRSENLPAYQVEPNLFSHTGLHSTLYMDQKHPQEFIFLE